jgi:hypothetical protein
MLANSVLVKNSEFGSKAEACYKKFLYIERCLFAEYGVGSGFGKCYIVVMPDSGLLN